MNPEQMTHGERFRAIRALVDDRDMWIARYARDLTKFEPLERFKLTARQRRVIGSLRVQRELSRLHDENNRIVVQQYSKDHPNNVHCWALNREGGPADIKGKVRSLKDNRVVMEAPRKW